ncbi:MAG TPA: sugar ABC transporter ATP-binding protein [Steroidobacteraceae bacterium]|nr:sugar ABC transporter ATP-binding protein [Steroidobacteraceae bacterium]
MPAAPLLDVRKICKQFPGVRALDSVDLQVQPGEVHALLGENGAGKSTLLKILSGALRADRGEAVLQGAALEPEHTPRERQRLGLITIYQEFNLLPFMSIAENLYLGREPKRYGLIDWAAMHEGSRAVLASLGLNLDPRTEVRHLSVAHQQMVEVGRAVAQQAKLIVMDEPTAALSGREVEILHAVIRGLKARGVSFIYVTHRLDEVKQICDGFTVLRDGRFVASGEVSTVQIRDLIRLMVGREVEFARLPRSAPAGAAVLSVKGISRALGAGHRHAMALEDLSIEVKAGEIVGFAGLVGAGRTELARIIFGADRCDRGVLYLNGREMRPLRSPHEAIRAGVALVPEDRKQQGCFLEQSITQNMTLPSLPRLARWGIFLDEAEERRLIHKYQTALRIKMPNPSTAVGTLSGGNQQKVLLARCMALEPKVLIVDEPTRGIDIGAKAEVHQLLVDMAQSGIALIVISSEMPEVLALSDRIVVFREGRISGTLDAAAATEHKLMQLMAISASAEAPGAAAPRAAAV